MHFARVLHGLGTIFKLFSFSLLVPFFGSFVWDDNVASSGIPSPFGGELRLTTVSFFLTFVIVLLTGFVLTNFAKVQLEELREREGYAIVGFAWLALAAFGGLPLILTRTTIHPLDAYFEIMSGLTTTGATALDPNQFDAIAPSVHLWRATTQYVGGLGIIVLAIAMLSQLTEGAHRLMAAETPGGTVTRLKPKITETAGALWVLYVGFAGVLFFILWFSMRLLGRGLPWKDAALDALITTFTTLSTGGFSNRAASIDYYDSSIITWIITLAMLLAGINFNLYWLFFHGHPGRIWKDPEARFYVAILLTAALAASAVLYNAKLALGASLEHGFFQAASFLTTTGYTSTDHNAFPDAGRLILFLLMFTGACTGSTAGGIKAFRILLLFRLARRELQKLLHPHAVSSVKVQGRMLSDEVLRRVIVFFFCYVTLVLAGSFVYTFLGMDFVSGVSASATLVGNVGPGFNQVAYSFHHVPDLGKAAGIVLMWMGRLEIFTVLILFVPATYRE